MDTSQERAQHAPGRMRAFEPEDLKALDHTYWFFEVGDGYHSDDPATGFHLSAFIRPDLARRLAAAWNATLHVPVEALETGGVGELLEALRDTRDVLMALAPIVFHDAVQDHLPCGVRERVEVWMRSTAAYTVVAKATDQEGR